MDSLLAGLILIMISLVTIASSVENEEVRNKININLGEMITGYVSSTNSWTLALNITNNTDKAIRYTVISNEANLSLPLFISIRQGRHISSLTLPYIEGGHSYSQVSRTLCPLLNTPLYSTTTTTSSTSNDVMIYIDISSPTHFNISFNISTLIVTDYKLRLNTPHNTTISSSSPIVHVYEYPVHVDRVLIKVTSLSLICALVSIQNDLCPVDQLLDTTDHRGNYQTMQQLAAINVQRPIHQNFVYIVITLYHHGNCSDTNYNFIDGLITFNRSANYDPVHIHDDSVLTKAVTIEIGHTLSIKEYLIAMVTPVGMYICMSVLLLLWLLIDGLICYRRHPAVKLLEEGQEKEKEVTDIERPSFLSVLKGDHWYQEMRKRTTPSPRSPDFILHEFARAYDSHSSSNNKPDQRPLMLPNVPSDQSFSTIDDLPPPHISSSHLKDTIDTQSSISCSSFGIEMRVKEDFPSDEEEEEVREEDISVNIPSPFPSPSPSPSQSPSHVFFSSNDKRRVSGRKRDLSIVIEESEEQPSVLSEEIASKTTPPTTTTTNNNDNEHRPTFNRAWLLHNHRFLHSLPIPEGSEFQKKYSGYWAYLLVIVIFYSLPVYQLVLTYQRFLVVSGNGDFCYYNSLCSHPLIGLSAFNNIWSNIGFFIVGVLIIIIALRRKSLYRFHEIYNEQCEQMGKHEEKLGVPQYFGVYYAAGISLMGEAIMSGAYHVCPTGSNYQFDTTMMFVLVTLGLYQLFKCRNPDITTSPYKLLLILACLILFIGMGVLYTGLIFYIIFFCIFEFGVLYTSLQIYYRWRLKVSHFKVIFKELLYNVTHPCPPQHKPKLVYCIISTVINILFGVYGLVYTPSDFATYFLIIMIGNFITSLIYYVITKIIYKEFGRKISIIKSIVYLCLAILCWVGGASLYSLSVTDWLKSPAGSRNGNQECLILNFYDSHDLWHFISSLALFFSFLLLMTLDDNEEFTNRSKLHVF